MKKLQAMRNSKIQEPAEWQTLGSRTGSRRFRAVFHRIELYGAVETPDGEMLCVGIRQRVDFADPDTDVAVLIGKVPLKKASGKPDPQPPELWFYEDRFWVKAVDGMGIPYYNQKRYVLYQIEVQNPDGLMASLDHGYDTAPE
jgi:hypothetical protein